VLSCGHNKFVKDAHIVTDQTTIEISKEDIKFSAAHFTIFSATERERLHGHNFAVMLSVTAPVGDDGICFSYKEIKTRLREICDSLDEYMLLPTQSPYLTIAEEGEFYFALFNGERIPFLKKETLLLPIRNTTVEELARHVLNLFIDDGSFVRDRNIMAVEVKVSSGPGQRGSRCWPA